LIIDIQDYPAVIRFHHLSQNPGLCVSVYKEVSSYPCTDVMRRLFENKDTCNDNWDILIVRA